MSLAKERRFFKRKKKSKKRRKKNRLEVQRITYDEHLDAAVYKCLAVVDGGKGHIDAAQPPALAALVDGRSALW